MNGSNFVSSIAFGWAIPYVLIILMCLGYVWSGIAKIINFNRAANEFSTAFGLPLPKVMLIANIIVVLVGPALMISGWAIWLGALILAGFTFVATLIAHPFWRMKDRDRQIHLFIFLNHVCITAAFLFVAWQSARGFL